MEGNILDHVKKLHFVGIGGSGMCPMAEILFHKGCPADRLRPQ